MADFHQPGRVTTIHDLRLMTDQDRRLDLSRWSAESPISLIIPTLFSDLDSQVFEHIIDELAEVDYVREIIVGLDRADHRQFSQAKQVLDRLPQHHRVLWTDSPTMAEFENELAANNVAPIGYGKGRNVWLCLGYFLASDRGKTVAVHDSDIVDYSRSMLDRLLYLVAHPGMEVEAAKGFYARNDQQQLTGRVTRLLMAPLFEALRGLGDSEPALEYLEFLSDFRYVLSGEHAMTTAVARSVRLPAAWSVELEFLASFYNYPGARNICQVEITDQYDHKHQDLSPADGGGLVAMAGEIVAALARQLAASGLTLDEDSLVDLAGSYRDIANQMLESYRRDAIANGLSFDVGSERIAVEVFAKAVLTADLSQPPQVGSSWHSVESRIPHSLERLAKIVEADNA
ncbi:MAG: glycosyl transferase [Actinobacteria bacterium]|nr:glycosyl transferase [Actinomycetota bacterium]